MGEIMDWSRLPNDMFVVSAKTDDAIVYDASMCSVPMALAPEVRYIRSDAAAARIEQLEAALREISELNWTPGSDTYRALFAEAQYIASAALEDK